MAETAQRLMSVEEFLDWQTRQEELFELVDGVPVMLAKAMSGASHSHDRIVVNLIARLDDKLGDGPCRPTTADIAVRTSIRGIRRPDVTVECAELEEEGHEARAPRMVVEVFSPSTMNVDRFRKLEEYRRLPTLEYILLIETRRPALTLYRRDTSRAWLVEDFIGLDVQLDLPAIGVTLTAAEIYAKMRFAEA